MSKSYTPPDRSTYDPGWNDPPPMPVPNADGAANKPAKTKLNLNKRIAFPMGGVGASPSSNSNVKTTTEGLPLPFSTAKYQAPPAVFQPAPCAPEVPPPNLPLPPPAAVPLLPPASMPTEANSPHPNESGADVATASAATDNATDLSTAREFCQLVFGRFSDAMAQKLDASRLAEIRKRLDVLNSMWLDNKFDQSTQIDLYNIAKALDENNVEGAKEQHRQLAVNHINACHQWGTALRQIILSINDAHSEQNNQDGPAILPDNEVNVVQLLNVGSTAHVIDAAAPFSINPPESIVPSVPNIAPSVPAATHGDVNSGFPQPVAEPKPGKSRFGPILHI